VGRGEKCDHLSGARWAHRASCTFHEKAITSYSYPGPTEGGAGREERRKPGQGGQFSRNREDAGTGPRRRNCRWGPSSQTEVRETVLGYPGGSDRTQNVDGLWFFWESHHRARRLKCYRKADGRQSRSRDPPTKDLVLVEVVPSEYWKAQRMPQENARLNESPQACRPQTSPWAVLVQTTNRPPPELLRRGPRRSRDGTSARREGRPPCAMLLTDRSSVSRA